MQVVYGVKGLKTHAKICLVVRREQGMLRRYCHFGTGNYNEVLQLDEQIAQMRNSETDNTV